MFEIERKVFYSLTQAASLISRRMKRFIKDEILSDIDFSVFDTCV